MTQELGDGLDVDAGLELAVAAECRRACTVTFGIPAAAPSRLSNPERVYSPASGATKLDLAQYYLSVGDGIVRALRERPCMLHRCPKGVAGETVHQKRLPRGAPPWMETVELYFPRYGRTADELCVPSWPT